MNIILYALSVCVNIILCALSVCVNIIMCDLSVCVCVSPGAVMSHVFLSVGAFEVCVLAENKVGSVSHCVPVSVLHRMQCAYDI